MQTSQMDVTDRAEPGASVADMMIQTILVVDDSRAQLKIISSILRRWGFAVFEATSGSAALKLAAQEPIDLVISDWMMPEMTGLELRAKLRQVFDEQFVYFILLTSRTEKTDIATALESGADDFLSKPLNIDELHARISAADRLTRMQRELARKNALITETLDELKGIYASVDRDLAEAGAFQQSLVRDRLRRFDGADVSLVLHSSGPVGGDLVGMFRATNDRVGLYAIDVSGHGIASAMIAARLASYFSGSTPDSNIALKATEDGGHEMLPLCEVCHLLNRLVLNEMNTEMYFTVILADVHLKTGQVSLVQAGHPHPLIMRKNGDIEAYGGGGVPVGLVSDPEFATFDVTLEAGDRLMLCSDGFLEHLDTKDPTDDITWLVRAMAQAGDLRNTAFLDRLVEDVKASIGGGAFADDVSGVLLEFHGPKRP